MTHVRRIIIIVNLRGSHRNLLFMSCVRNRSGVIVMRLTTIYYYIMCGVCSSVDKRRQNVEHKRKPYIATTSDCPYYYYKIYCTIFVVRVRVDMTSLRCIIN